MFVDRTGFQSREHVRGKKFPAQILHHNFAGAGGVRFIHNGIKIIALTDVADHGNYIVGIVFPQPGNNDRGIQPTRVGKHHFFRHGRS